MAFSLAKNGVSHLNPNCQTLGSIRTGEASSGAGDRHWVSSSRRVNPLPGMQLLALDDWIMAEASTEGSSYQGETKGAYCWWRSWNVGVSDQAVCQGQRRLIRPTPEPIPLRE